MTNQADEGFELLGALKVLGLTGAASPAEAKKAYHQLCKVWHPDRFPEDPDLQKAANARLAEINAAYDVVEKVLAAREEQRQKAEEEAKKKREAEAARRKPADERQKKASEAAAAKEKQRLDAEALQWQIQQQAESLVAEKVASVKQAAWVIGVVAVIIAAFMFYSMGAISASATSAASSAPATSGLSSSGSVDEATLSAAKQSSYDDGFTAGKASVPVAGKYYIRIDKRMKLTANSDSNWYIVSLEKNSGEDASLAPLRMTAVSKKKWSVNSLPRFSWYWWAYSQ